jgi:hypothetical protein
MQPVLNIDQAAHYSWMDSTMHMSPDQVMRFLQDVACCPPGSSIDFDYAPAMFAPQRLEHMLRHFGFRHIEHLDAAAGFQVIRATV